jgi:hypothetical protein
LSLGRSEPRLAVTTLRPGGLVYLIEASHFGLALAIRLACPIVLIVRFGVKIIEHVDKVLDFSFNDLADSLWCDFRRGFAMMLASHGSLLLRLQWSELEERCKLSFGSLSC